MTKKNSCIFNGVKREGESCTRNNNCIFPKCENMRHWFTSDTHAFHKGIVRGTSEWEDKQKTRDFDTVEEMTEKMASNFNKLVKSDDILYHIGDWSFGGFDNIKRFRDMLNCNTIHLILGNHDHHIERNKNGIQGLFSSVGYYKEITLNKQRIVLSHYAMRVWNKSHHGSWMLYGQSHGTLDKMTPQMSNPTWIGDMYYIKNYKTMDVGVDTNNLEPYSLDELHTIMDPREVLLDVDHHKENTN